MVSPVQCFGPFRKHYVKLPSHLDGSQPQSIFSIGTKPGEQGSASRHNHHALQHTLSPFIWAFSLLWVTLQMHHTRPHAPQALLLRHGDNVCKVSRVGAETLTYRHCWGSCCSPSLMALWTGCCRWTLRRRENTINSSTLTLTAL